MAELKTDGTLQEALQSVIAGCNETINNANIASLRVVNGVGVLRHNEDNTWTVDTGNFVKGIDREYSIKIAESADIPSSITLSIS